MVAQVKDKDTEWRPPEGAFDLPPGGSDIPFWDDSWKDELPGWISGATMRPDGSVWGYNYSGGYGNIYKGGPLTAEHMGQEGSWGFTGEAEIGEGGASPKPWSWTPPDDAYEPPTPSDAGGTGSGGGVTKTAEASFGNYHRIYNDDGTATIFPIDESLKIAKDIPPGKGGSPGQPYQPPKEDPNNPYVPAPGKTPTKLAQSGRSNEGDTWNWIDKTYGHDAGQWYKDNLDKPLDQNPFIDGYIPFTDEARKDSLGGEIAQIASTDLGGLGIADQNKVAALLEAGDLAQKKQNLKDTWGIVRESEQVPDPVQDRKASSNYSYTSPENIAELDKLIEDTEYTFGEKLSDFGKEALDRIPTDIPKTIEALENIRDFPMTIAEGMWDVGTEGAGFLLDNMKPEIRDKLLDSIAEFPLGPWNQIAPIVKSAYSGKQSDTFMPDKELNAALESNIYNNTIQKVKEYQTPSDDWYFFNKDTNKWIPHTEETRQKYPKNDRYMSGIHENYGNRWSWGTDIIDKVVKAGSDLLLHGQGFDPNLRALNRENQEIELSGAATGQVVHDYWKNEEPIFYYNDASYMNTGQTAEDRQIEVGEYGYKGAEALARQGGNVYRDNTQFTDIEGRPSPNIIGLQSQSGELPWSKMSDKAKAAWAPNYIPMDKLLSAFEETGPKLNASGVDQAVAKVRSLKYKKGTPSNYKKDKTYDILQSPLIWNQKQGTGASGKTTYQTFGLNI